MKTWVQSLNVSPSPNDTSTVNLDPETQHILTCGAECFELEKNDDPTIQTEADLFSSVSWKRRQIYGGVNHNVGPPVCWWRSQTCSLFLLKQTHLKTFITICLNNDPSSGP